MEIYTSNCGNTQLLLCIHGTVPITYLSIPYNIPVAFWIPREYPSVSPIPYVKPTTNMLIREGIHVDKSGLCYHQYISSWSNNQTHHLLELVAILQQVFAREPPVYTKPNTNMNSPQFQESLLNSQSSPTLPRRPTSNQKPPSPWLSENTIHHLKQGLSSMHISHPISKSASVPLPHVTSTPIRSNTTDGINMGKSRHDLLYKRLMDRLHSYSKSSETYLIQNRQLCEAEASIEHEYKILCDVKERLQFNQGVLETRSVEIEKITKQVNIMPDVQIDETLCGTSVVGNQLFELVADENAISDTIYLLAKALNSERIDLSTFMKYTRMLSREQFMKRALIKKIAEQMV
ncbi:unnamed protein product [Rhizopus stolonifer]